MIWQYIATVMVFALVAKLIGRAYDSPFPRIYTAWTYVELAGDILLALGIPAMLVCLIWGW